MENDHADVAHLIRSLQRAEGNPDCFRSAENHCTQEDCAWRELCLGKPQNHTGYEMGGGSDPILNSWKIGEKEGVRQKK